MSPARAVRRSLDPEYGAVHLPGLSGLGQDCAAPPHPGPSSADPPPSHPGPAPPPGGPRTPALHPEFLHLALRHCDLEGHYLELEAPAPTRPYQSGDPAASVSPGLSFPTCCLSVAVWVLTAGPALWSGSRPGPFRSDSQSFCSSRSPGILFQGLVRRGRPRGTAPGRSPVGPPLRAAALPLAWVWLSCRSWRPVPSRRLLTFAQAPSAIVTPLPFAVPLPMKFR